MDERMDEDGSARVAGRAMGYVVVPEVWGDSEGVALDKLLVCGLLPGRRQEEPSRSFQPGSVFGTIPPAGALVKRGDRIAYIVATGTCDLADPLSEVGLFGHGRGLPGVDQGVSEP